MSVSLLARSETPPEYTSEPALRSDIPLAPELSTESDLVSRSRAGDLQAFGMLYHRHEALIFRHAYRLLDDKEDAADVRQETFVRAYGALARFRGEARFSTYLLTICSNLCRDRLRQRLRRAEHRYGLVAPENLTFSGGVGSADNPLTALEREATAGQVRLALSQMPPAQREIILLHHVEGLSIEDVARITGCTRLSAPVRLFRARQKFKAIYLSILQDGEKGRDS